MFDSLIFAFILSNILKQTRIREKHLETGLKEKEFNFHSDIKKEKKKESIGFAQNLSIKIIVVCRSPRRWREKKRG